MSRALEGCLDRLMAPHEADGVLEIAVADVAVGADVMVWSESQDDGSFLAQRVAVLPAAATTDSTDDSATPEASPAATVG